MNVVMMECHILLMCYSNMSMCSPPALVGEEKKVLTVEPVVSKDSPSTRKSSFREKLSQKFSSKKTSPVMAKKEQKPGVCVCVCVCV